MLEPGSPVRLGTPASYCGVLRGVDPAGFVFPADADDEEEPFLPEPEPLLLGFLQEMDVLYAPLAEKLCVTVSANQAPSTFDLHPLAMTLAPA